jgi:hypothetical protein
MDKAWDTRCRRWYGDRFDMRRNLVRGGLPRLLLGPGPAAAPACRCACCTTCMGKHRTLAMLD